MPSKEILEGKPFADYRQLTGKLAYNAYVYVKNKVVRACDHEHRKASAAKKCVDELLAAHLQQDAETDREELDRLRDVIESLRRLCETAEMIVIESVGRPYTPKMVHASDVIDIIEGRLR